MVMKGGVDLAVMQNDRGPCVQTAGKKIVKLNR